MLFRSMGGGLLLGCCDGCIRDIASIHGTYRQVHETQQTIELIGDVLQSFTPKSVLWLFDKPVSNMAGLRDGSGYIAEAHRWNWQADVVDNKRLNLASCRPQHTLSFTGLRQSYIKEKNNE